MKGFAKVILIVIFTVIILLGMVGYIFLKSSNNNSSNSSDTTIAPTLDVPVKDYAPGLPMAQKTTILIQTSDSSEIKYIVPTSEVATYIKNLPVGYHVMSKSP